MSYARAIGTLNRSHASQLLLQLRFGIPIRFVEGINGVFQVVKLTELMGYLGKDKSDGTADGFLPIGDHAFDRYRKLFEPFFDFFE